MNTIQLTSKTQPMYDIKFVEESLPFKKSIVEKSFKGDVYQELEKLRPSKPTVYQLETTNVCNMTCVMCPRTEKMQRKLGYMDVNTFRKIVEQLEPQDQTKWADW